MEVDWRFRSAESASFSSGKPAKSYSQSIYTLTHPLQPKSAYYTVPVQPGESAASNGAEYQFCDPLGATIDDDGVVPMNVHVDHDVLSDLNTVTSARNVPVLQNTLESTQTDRMVFDVVFPNFDSWRKRRQQILDNFSTGEKFTITSSFLSPSSMKPNGSDKTKRRLEVLEDLSGLRKLSELSQSEFVAHVNELRELLITAWHNNKRVEAVRLVTELARMLSSTTNSTFYPHQWVLVTDILDLFGKFVYERLEAKSKEERRSLGQSPLPKHFSSTDIPPMATEMAKNWFCKVADIKELVPRFYVETALIACLRFLDDSNLRVNILRLATMTAKFPHVLLAAYARAYICKMSMILEPADRAPHWRCINDWMQSSMPNSPELTWPALEWVIQCVSYGATNTQDLGPLWEYCKQDDKISYLLRAFLNGIPVDYLANHALEILPLVVSKGAGGSDLTVFGQRLLLTNTTDDSTRATILRSVWKKIVRLGSLREYLRCCVTWSGFASRFFSVNEVFIIADSLLSKLSTEKNLDPFLSMVMRIVENMIEFRTSEDLIPLLKSGSFVALIDLLGDEPFASQCAVSVLKAFVRVFDYGSVEDMTIAHQITENCGRVCRSLKADALEDEIRSNCLLICAALDRVCVTGDVDGDKVLAWLVNNRATLGHWPIVTQYMVCSMVHFSLWSSESMKDSRKKSNFTRACIANLFITIPSIDDPSLRFNCCLRTVCVSLAANALMQTDALISLSVGCLSELTSHSSFHSMVSHLLAILISVPDSPSKPMLNHFNQLITVVEGNLWSDASSVAEIWLSCIQYLWSISQPNFPGKVEGVHANDLIYGFNEEYRSLVQDRTAYVMQKLIDLVTDETSSKPVISMMVLECIAYRVEINAQICRVVSNLLKKCARSGLFTSRLEPVVTELRQLSTTNTDLNASLLKMKLI